MDTPFISISDLRKSFGTLEVLRGLSFSVQKGEVVAIVGSSGAGKTTLLQIMGTLDSPSSGEVQIHGVNPHILSARKQAVFRNRHLGFVFQFHELLPEFTALENVALPAFIAGDLSRRDALREAKELLTSLGLADRLHHAPRTLSGGEKQRVAVARALINHPDVLLADEPSGSLDSKNKEELHQLFFRLSRERELTIIFVTHDHAMAERADRIITLHDGLIASEQSPSSIISKV
ncbi:MAG: ABC transporter ATP-binding protein [Bacteroidales bacterium]|nr:ABC transporter ATP-binding protein [Porphyromonas sp.]MDD6934334.1 ABC transporter ATP-binding protein [Bacteroidales bacterium]MDY3102575.1 ABC transporter ATP-binding protein [Porphyromonas sp.]